MLSQALLAGAERSIAAAVSRDPLTGQRLGQLQGKVLFVQASDPDWQLYLLPDAQGIQLLGQSELQADCSLRAPTSLLLRLAFSSERQQLLQDPALQLSGDSQVLISLQRIIADLQLDGEAELARWLGPVPAHIIGSTLYKGWQWGQNTGRSLSQSLGEYLTEESRHLVGNNETAYSGEQIHALRLQLDRLEARIQRLEMDPEDRDA
ncbi:MAG: SCP2 sterol-binding domain-containing protein [Gammaproteobacteria bacterium]|nr:SCP2 sterol-binding domain-containing protein [Gammaproteobacteria bacterium]